MICRGCGGKKFRVGEDMVKRACPRCEGSGEVPDVATKKMGRPTMVSEAKIKRILSLREKGNTIEKIAQLTGVAMGTVYSVISKKKEER